LRLLQTVRLTDLLLPVANPCMPFSSKAT